MPTPSPARKREPRWRTMISPPLTVSPANVLTPRRWAFESRPLREEPSPFLCAMLSPLLGQAFDEQRLPLLDAVLLAAGLDDCVGHGGSQLSEGDAEVDSRATAVSAVARERRHDGAEAMILRHLSPRPSPRCPGGTSVS